MTTNLLTSTLRKSDISKTLALIDQQLFKDLNIIIAGGSVRKAFTGEILDSSDYDVFFKTPAEFKKAVELVKSYGVLLSTHDNCVSFTLARTGNGIPNCSSKNGAYIQLISKEYHESISDLLYRFDFTICQFAYHDGVVYYTAEALEATKSRTLTLNNKKKHDISSDRVLKYTCQGFSPDIRLFEKFFIEGRNALNVKSIALSSYNDLYGTI